jgi:lysophospholipase L1-like esterase
MTIQMLRQWNGLEAFSVHTLDGAEETRLVAIGLAKYVAAPGLPCPPVFRPRPLRKCWQGRIKSLATSGANHTTRVMTVLEAPADRIRIGILNCVAAEIVNARVRVTATDTMLGLNTSLAGTLSGSVSVLTAAFNVAAGTDVHSPAITWSPWLDLGALDRIDGGTLPVYMIAVEIPGSGNANRPAWDDGGQTRAAWEDPAATNGRPWKMRGDAVLGATTNSAGTSTAFFDDGIPFIIEYMPRIGSAPLTLTCYGDSITEGAGATVRGYGWPYLVQSAISSQSRPVEVCNLAMGSATMAQIASRIEATAPSLRPELAIVSAFSPNGVSAPTYSWASTARSQFQALQRALHGLSAVESAVVIFSGVPMLSQAGEPASGNKDLNAEGAANLNRYMGLVLSSPWPTIDAYNPLAGPPDADGQITFGTGMTADGVHPSDAGHAAIASAAQRAIAQFGLF